MLKNTPKDVKQDVKPRTGSARRRRCQRTALSAVAFLLMLNVGITLLLVQWLLPEHRNVVAFDMRGTVDQFMAQAGSRGLSEDQSAVLSARFTAALNDSLLAYQKDNRAIVLVKPAVVLGVKDITGDIKRDIAERMRKE